jgi:hypothetical protein
VSPLAALVMACYYLGTIGVPLAVVLLLLYHTRDR